MTPNATVGGSHPAQRPAVGVALAIVSPSSPQPSVIRGLIAAEKLENPLVSANNRGTSPPRPFDPRRFSSERQCPSPVEPTQAENPPPDREPARRRTPSSR